MTFSRPAFRSFVLVSALGVATPAAAQNVLPPSEAAELGPLRDEVRELRLKLAQIELALDKAGIAVGGDEPSVITPPPAAGGAGGAVDATRWGRVVRVERVEPETSEAAEAEREALRAEVESLRDAAAAARGDVAGVVPDGRGLRDGGGAYRGDRGDDAVNQRERRQAVREARAERRAEAADAQGAIENLRRAEDRLAELDRAAEPQRVFELRRGDTLIELRLPESAGGDDYTPAWAAVSWDGELLSQKPGRQTWAAASLREVTAAELERLDAGGSADDALPAADTPPAPGVPPAPVSPAAPAAGQP